MKDMNSKYVRDSYNSDRKTFRAQLINKGSELYQRRHRGAE